MRILLSFFLLLSFTTKAQDSIPAFIRDSLDLYVERALQEWQIPGVSVAIIKNGKVVVMKGYGVKEAGKTDKVDEHTLFAIGSNTKAFTGTALALLDADKKLSLDDHVIKWLPTFKLYDPWVTQEVNLRDIVSHRMGFETFQGDFMYFDSDLTKQEVLEKLAKVKPMYGFRSKWGYTNAGFLAAGEVIEKASGLSWDKYIEEKIFRPLQMNRSLALSKNIPTATNRASAHTVVLDTLKVIPYGMIDNLAPAGSIVSSVYDMSHWLQMHLDKGKFNGQQVMPASALNQTYQPLSILGNGSYLFNKGHFNLYGMGWFLEEYSGRKIISHTGGVNGFVTSVTLVPEENLGILVFTNTDQNNFYEALKWEIMDAYLGNTYRNYSKLYVNWQNNNNKQLKTELGKKRDSIATKPATALPLQAYTGNYENEMYGKMKIENKGGKLYMTFEHHKGRWGTLEALGGNRFFCTYSDPLYGMKDIPFTVENGKVKSVTVRVADFVEFTPYEFRKIPDGR